MGFKQLVKRYIDALRKFLKETHLHKLQRKRQKVLDEITINEKKLLKRDINEKTFRELNEKFSKELIALEAEIEIEKVKERLGAFTETESRKLSDRRKYDLRKLLGEKEKILKELGKAKTLYMKRKIDEQSYKSIIKEKQEHLIAIEADITSLYRDEAKAIMKEAEKKISISEENELVSEAEEIASDIAGQTESKSRQRVSSKPKRRERRKARR